MVPLSNTFSWVKVVIYCISIEHVEIALQFYVSKDLMDSMPALVQILAWHWAARCQAIIWTNDGLDNWSIFLTRYHNEINEWLTINNCFEEIWKYICIFYHFAMLKWQITWFGEWELDPVLLNTVIWCCHNHFSQWKHSFHWKLCFDWLKWLWQCQVSVIMHAIVHVTQSNSNWFPNSTKMHLIIFHSSLSVWSLQNLHKPRQLCCLGKYKISLWLDQSIVVATLIQFAIQSK